jgi:hypothetical protein
MYLLIAVLIWVSVGNIFKHGLELSTFVDAWNSFSFAQSTGAEGKL